MSHPISKTAYVIALALSLIALKPASADTIGLAPADQAAPIVPAVGA